MNEEKPCSTCLKPNFLADSEYPKIQFQVPDPSLDNGSSDKTSGGGGKVRIVQFSEETALSRSIRRKTTSAKLDGKD